MPKPGLYDRVLAEMERPLFQLTLAATHGNVVRAAQRLGLHPRQLYRLIERFSIDLRRHRD